LEEIGGDSVSGFRFPRRTFQDGLGSCVSSRGEIVGSSSVYSNLSGQDRSHCSSIFATAMSSQLSSRCSTVRTSTHSSYTVLSSRALDPVFLGLGSLYSYPGSSLSSSVLVAAEGKCHDRVSLASAVPSLTLFADASLLGWGPYLDGQTVSGMWSSTLQKDHINLWK
jgi:hypothetical protein